MRKLEIIAEELRKMAPIIKRKLDNLRDNGLPPQVLEKAQQEVNSRAMMEELIARRFATHSSAGRPWSPDKPKTTQQKAKDGDAGDTLHKTGALKQAAVRAAAGTFTMTQPIHFDIDRLGLRYAKMVAKKRPFYVAPSTEELRPALDVASRVIVDAIEKAMNS